MPPQSSELFVFSGSGSSAGVGAQRSMSQLSLFDTTLERNEEHAPPRLHRPIPLRALQTDLHEFLGLPPRRVPVRTQAAASPVPSDVSVDVGCEL